jgi:hypothetical protein
MNTNVDLASMNDEELDSFLLGGEDNQGIEEEPHVSPTSESDEEQPTEDADEYTEEDSTEDSTDDEQLDESSEEETDTESEEEEEEEDSDTDTESEDEEETTESDEKTDLGKIELKPIKANGKEYEVKSIDELYKLASAGIGVQSKFQAIAKYKKEIVTAEELGIDLSEAVNVVANMKEDPYGTIKALIKQYDIDESELSMGLDEDVNTELKDYRVSDDTIVFNDIIKEIGNTPQFDEVKNVVLNEWDEASRNRFFKDPTLFKGLHQEMLPNEVLNGKTMFEVVKPEMEKVKLLNPGLSDYEAYLEARQIKVAEIEKHLQAKEQVNSKIEKKKAKTLSRKKKASPSTRSKPVSNIVKDLSKLSDEELEKIILQG